MRRGTTTRALTAALVAAVVTAGAWLRAQTPQASPPAPSTPASQAGQRPVFRSGVDLIAVDAAVVDKDGNPIAGVKPEQFEVTVDGKPRRVVSAEFLEFTTRHRPASIGAVPDGA